MCVGYNIHPRRKWFWKSSSPHTFIIAITLVSHLYMHCNWHPFFFVLPCTCSRYLSLRLSHGVCVCVYVLQYTIYHTVTSAFADNESQQDAFCVCSNCTPHIYYKIITNTHRIKSVPSFHTKAIFRGNIGYMRGNPHCEQALISCFPGAIQFRHRTCLPNMLRSALQATQSFDRADLLYFISFICKCSGLPLTYIGAKWVARCWERVPSRSRCLNEQYSLHTKLHWF